MKNLLLVALGGAVGSGLRYLTSQFVSGRFSESQFPYGTLTVNILGCFLIGVAYAMASRFDWFTPQLRLFVATGICGGYTTFSAFAYENFNLLESGNQLTAFIYIVASFAICLLATGVGVWVVRSI